MIIFIRNQKGGAGKSTFTMLLANYLSLSRQTKVTVIDMDYQQSISRKYQRAKLLENAEPYEVVAAVALMIETWKSFAGPKSEIFNWVPFWAPYYVIIFNIKYAGYYEKRPQIIDLRPFK